MIEIAIMIEGQNGLTWPRWQKIVKATEDLGFIGIFRSDHFTNANEPDKSSLELWTSLTWLASHTKALEFGPMVSPVSFRHPTFTARFAAAVDDLSEGRLILGLGAGWQEREHHLFGHHLTGRFDRLEEGLEVITRLLKSDDPVSYEGKYFQLREALLLPRPVRKGGPPILIGGNGPKRTLPLVAKFADEWNSLFIPAEKFEELNTRLDQLLTSEGRDPTSVRRSMMTGCIFGEDEKEVSGKVKSRGDGKFTQDDLLNRGLIVGTADQIVDQINHLAEAGVQRVMLQWLDLDDLDGLKALAAGVLPKFS
jgi:F420-dependent oxidoreductase-like protein